MPLYDNVGKVVPALLAGCTVVLKPAPDTPATAAFMGELAVEAGFPPGVFNVITSADPVMAGEALVADPRVDVVSFTGSTAVGKRIMQNAGATLKRVFLELGGFDNWVTEDNWFSRKFAAKGYRAACNRNMRVRYSSRRFHANGFLRTLGVWAKASVTRIPLGEYKPLDTRK